MCTRPICSGTVLLLFLGVWGTLTQPTTILFDDHHYPSYIVSLRKTKVGGRKGSPAPARPGRINLARCAAPSPSYAPCTYVVCLVCYLSWNAPPHYRICTSLSLVRCLKEGSFRVGMGTAPTYVQQWRSFFLPRQWHLLSHSRDLHKQTCYAVGSSILQPFIPIPRQTEVIRHDMPFSTPLHFIASSSSVFKIWRRSLFYEIIHVCKTAKFA